MARAAFAYPVPAPSYGRRQSQDPVDRALMRASPALRNALDEQALRTLREADTGRALEIIEDIISKGDVRNPSAFIMKAIGRFPHQRGGGGHYEIGGGGGGHYEDVDRTLARHPILRQLLDDSAIQQLRSADPERALEIIEDMTAKSISDLRNPSAFVATALRNYPQKRGGGGQQYMVAPSQRASAPRFAMSAVDQALARCPRIARALDEEAVQRLRSVEPARAVEIIEDAASKPDIRNPSAFVSKALTSHPHKRGRENAGFDDGGYSAKRQRAGSNSSAMDFLDEKAQDALRCADPERAREILEELESKGSVVRNPNAFVTKALSQYPKPRGRSHAF